MSKKPNNYRFNTKYKELSRDNETKNFFYCDKNLFDYSTIEEANILNNDIILDFPSLRVFFRNSGEGRYQEPIMLRVPCGEKMSEVIQRYRDKSGDNDPSKKFVFNAEQMNLGLNTGEIGLTNNANIFVVTTRGVKGAGYGMMFTDLSKNKTKELKFASNAPSYREVTKGINVFGICNYKKCKAYKNEVVVMIKKKKIDLIKERDNLFCPLCESSIIPKTVGFYLCKFSIYGKKLENDICKKFMNEIGEAKNEKSVQYFDPDLNGEVMIIELIIEVLQYF